MTTPATLDSLRTGLSFSEETALLIGLRRGHRHSQALAPWSRLPEVREQAQNLSRPLMRQLSASLVQDLEVSPIAVDPHPQFASALMASLPSSARQTSLADAASPWVRAQIPLVSGRIRRSKFELASLLTLDQKTRRAVLLRSVRLALRVVLDGLNERRRLVLSRSLPFESESDTLALPPSIMRNTQLLDSLREGVARASAGARDLVHVLDRLAIYLLATALLGTHHCELNAFKAVLSARQTRRLGRFYYDTLPGRSSEVTGVRDLMSLAYQRERGDEVPNG